MSRSHSYSSAGAFGVLFLCLAIAQAQIASYVPTQEACNEILNYPCFGGVYCCTGKKPASCIAHPGASVPFLCIDASAFPVNNGPGGTPGEQIFPNGPTTPIPGPVIIPTPPVFPPAGGKSSTTLPLPSSSLTTSVTTSSSSSTTSVTLPSTSTSRSTTSTLPLPSSTTSSEGGSNGGGITPSLPSITIPTPIVPTPIVPTPIVPFPSVKHGNSSSEGSEPASNGTSNNSSHTPSNGTPGDGHGNGTVEYTGAAALRTITGSSWWGGIAIAATIQLWRNYW